MVQYGVLAFLEARWYMDATSLLFGLWSVAILDIIWHHAE